MSCEFCASNNYKNEPYLISQLNGSIRALPLNYCPVCGRALNAKARRNKTAESFDELTDAMDKWRDKYRSTFK